MSSSMPTLYFIESLSLSSIKVLHQFLTFSMSLAATKAAYFCHHFTKCSFFYSSLFEVPTLEGALLPHISMDLLQGRHVA